MPRLGSAATGNLCFGVSRLTYLYQNQRQTGVRYHRSITITNGYLDFSPPRDMKTPVAATVPQLTAAAAGGEPSGEQPTADGGTAWTGTAA